MDHVRNETSLRKADRDQQRSEDRQEEPEPTSQYRNVPHRMDPGIRRDAGAKWGVWHPDMYHLDIVRCRCREHVVANEGPSGGLLWGRVPGSDHQDPKPVGRARRLITS
jgi:hypothetical protein